MSITNHKYYRSFFVFIVCSTSLSFLVPANCFAQSGQFELNCPYWFMTFDDSAYMDITYYYPTPRHQESAHEMCTGDVAAAVSYSGLNESGEAEWLTDSFVVPSFPTYSPFTFTDDGIVNNPFNPVWTDQGQPTGYVPGSNYYSIGSTGNDTAWSTLDDGKLGVTIHYEVVDLDEQDANGVGGSPMSFRDANGTPVYVFSERYILLLTYVFKNINPTHQDINSIEFYQMMHGHPAESYSNNNGMYETANFYDPLADYAPYDPNHQVGNFKYDITLWNSGDPETQHVDWMSLSSNMEPVHFDFGTFEGHDYSEPTTGTYVRIKERSLNDQNSLENGEVAGAMQFNLGNLTYGQSTSITLALMYGVGPIQTTPPIPPIDVTLTIADDINVCVYPSNEFFDNYINYNICYAAGEDINDVNIIDILPEDVYFQSCTGGGDYNEPLHQVVWDLGNLDANDANCFTLTVKVADFAQQGSTITNTAKMYSGNTLLRTTNESTKICCETTIIYVDKNAPTGGDGKTWQTAYQELRDALANTNTCTREIWVADGTYAPTDNPYDSSATFQMLDGVDVYGHFGGIDSNETQLCQRNFADANNETILTGDINGNGTSDVSYVATAADSRLDGFTVRKGSSCGIYAAACSPTTIANCVVNYNARGIYCLTGTLANITNTFVNNNSEIGICSESGSDININKSTVSTNASNLNAYNCDVNALDSVFSNASDGAGTGIYTSICNLTLKGCDISDNSGVAGIRCDKGIAAIQNCRIQRNTGYGLQTQYADQSDVVLKNNIISDNDSAGIYMEGGYNSEVDWQIIDNMIYSNSDNGIKISSGSNYAIEIRNNTITKNTGYGIYRTAGPEPAINSNIIYANTTGSLYDAFTNVHYNCIQNCVETNNNINDNPEFRNATANDFHLIADSNCINAGNPSTSGTNETDIDGEARKIGSAVDMGSDEHCPYDLSLDGCVDFEDFAIFAKAWGTHTGQTDFNDRCDFYDDGATDYINYMDLEIFCDYWLSPVDWQDIGGNGASFTVAECPLQGGEMMMMSIPPQSSESLLVSPANTLAGSEELSESVEPIEDVFDVNETLDWLDELWQTDESIRESTSEADWQEFLNSIKSSEQ